MKQSFEKPVTPERGAELFKEIKDAIKKEDEVEQIPRTGAGAMHDWEAEKEEIEEKRRLLRK